MKLLKCVSFLVVFIAFSVVDTVQAQKREPDMSDMFRQMQKMIERFQKDGNLSFEMPDFGDEGMNGFHFFKLDTAMFGDQMFKTMPFFDRKGGSGFDLEEMMRSFNQMGLMFDGFGFNQPPMDDGNTRQDDDLLPEEQLREKENGSPTPREKKPQPKKHVEQEKRKTIRI